MKRTLILVLTILFTACNTPAPEQKVHQILSERLMTLATAESCTGGEISRRITRIPGASVYFKGGVIAYSNELKRSLLDVDGATIGLHGIVSEQVARKMAEGARKATGASYAIATTGIAGPTGGTPETPVGTVWIAIATPTQTHSIRFVGGKTRNEVIELSSTAALEMLLEILQQE